MLPLQPVRVLILATDPEQSRRWAGLLAGVAADVFHAADEIPSGVRCDIVLTDLPTAGEAAKRSVRAPSYLSGMPTPESDPATIGVGRAGWTDVVLSEDFTAGELRVACQLLGEIVRLRDQTARERQLRQEAEKLADADPLTGLANRRVWERQLAAFWSSRGPAGQAWLAILDLDRFKEINDRCGFVAGDELLTEIAQRLARELRPEDVIARLGGDEFGLLLLGIDQEQVCQTLDRLRAAVSHQSLPAGVHALTASVGVAMASEDHCSAVDWFLAAERALRAAKQAGGDRVCHEREKIG